MKKFKKVGLQPQARHTKENSDTFLKKLQPQPFLKKRSQISLLLRIIKTSTKYQSLREEPTVALQTRHTKEKHSNPLLRKEFQSQFRKQPCH